MLIDLGPVSAPSLAIVLVAVLLSSEFIFSSTPLSSLFSLPFSSLSVLSHRASAGPPLADAPTTTLDRRAAAITTFATVAMSSSVAASSFRRSAPLIIPALGRHTATVFFFHGLGDQGSGWADAVRHWQQKRRLDGVKFVLPNAPTRPITVNSGFPSPGWYDLKILGVTVEAARAGISEDEAGILAAVAYAHSLVEDEIEAGIPSDRIVLGGFSQGGAVGLMGGLTLSVPIAGIIHLSSYLPLHKTFRNHVPEGDANKATPIFIGHGDRDILMLHESALYSWNHVKEMGYNGTFNTYRGLGHSVSLEELNDVEGFLVARLPNKAA
ncbi:hypothetical protein CDD83_9505 [Cordyceps sp. RAO-2017]|nr:hypothetical protein CDD83_9505 [Cordyceps sp. RAO-2017]